MASSKEGDQTATAQAPAAPPPVETDDFGLPIRKYIRPKVDDAKDDDSNGGTEWADAPERVGSPAAEEHAKSQSSKPQQQAPSEVDARETEASKDGDGIKHDSDSQLELAKTPSDTGTAPSKAPAIATDNPATTKLQNPDDGPEKLGGTAKTDPAAGDAAQNTPGKAREENPAQDGEKPQAEGSEEQAAAAKQPSDPAENPGHAHKQSITSISGGATGDAGVSEFSHQHLSTQPQKDKQEEEEEEEEDGWQEMPSYARYDMYDDDDRLIAREHNEEDDDDQRVVYCGLGGAGKGYTRVQLDEDAESANSMDDNTQYLFKEGAKGTALADEDDDARDAMSQMQATKDLLTEGQRIAYVGVVRLEIAKMIKEGQDLESPRKVKKYVAMSVEASKMWGQKMMIRLYAHMDISEAEQVMIEQLADHGVQPSDLVPALHANARVKNPMAAARESEDGQETEPRPSSATENPETEKGTTHSSTSLDKTSPESPSGSQYEKPPSGSQDERSPPGYHHENSPPGSHDEKSPSGPQDERPPKSPVSFEDEECAEPPPPYEAHAGDDVPDVQTPSQLPSTAKIDIDLRWTVLCDLFLILIADSIYDCRSRVLMERVGKSLDISWVDICRFEKRVADALEMQQAAEKENWNEDEHMENRRKRALKKRYMMLGLATVGGGLVIGLSAGLLAPVIGAGLAAGFSTIGVAGTSGFLGGVGGAAVITSSAAASGSIIGARAANRRTGAVKTFEYRPLHNNKRVNLIVTISGWLTGKVDDVRLPFSTVDPTMGDIYSVLWEPEMLRSTGDTVRILATEVSGASDHV